MSGDLSRPDTGHGSAESEKSTLQSAKEHQQPQRHSFFSRKKAPIDEDIDAEKKAHSVSTEKPKEVGPPPVGLFELFRCVYSFHSLYFFV